MVQLEAVLCLQEAVGIDEQTRVLIRERLYETEFSRDSTANFLGLTIGLPAAQLDPRPWTSLMLGTQVPLKTLTFFYQLVDEPGVSVPPERTTPYSVHHSAPTRDWHPPAFDDSFAAYFKTALSDA